MAFLDAVSCDALCRRNILLIDLSGLLGFVVYGIAIITVDADLPIDPQGTIDCIGSYLGVGALILFNFVWKYDLNSLCYVN